LPSLPSLPSLPGRRSGDDGTEDTDQPPEPAEGARPGGNARNVDGHGHGDKLLNGHAPPGLTRAPDGPPVDEPADHPNP